MSSQRPDAGRLSQIQDQESDLRNRTKEAYARKRLSRSEQEANEWRERQRGMQQATRQLKSEVSQMAQHANLTTSRQEAGPSFQQQPAPSGNQSYRQVSVPSNLGPSAPARPQGSSGEARTTQIPGSTVSTARDTVLSRQGQHRSSRSEASASGTSAIYGQSATPHRETSSGQGYSLSSDAQPSLNYQIPGEYGLNMAHQASVSQAAPFQQQSYYQGYPPGVTAPSVSTPSGKGSSSSSSEDEYVYEEVSPYIGSREQFRDAIATVAARSNTEPIREQRSYHSSLSGSGVYDSPTNANRGTNRSSHSGHRRSSSSPSNTVAGGSGLHPTGRPAPSSLAMGQAGQVALPVQSQPPNIATPASHPYRFPPLSASGISNPGNYRSGLSENRVTPLSAPSNVGPPTAHMQQLGFSAHPQSRAPTVSGSGLPLSGNPLGYQQQPPLRRASSPNTRATFSQNTSAPRRMSTPPLGVNTMSSSSRYPVSHQQTPTTRRGMSPGRSRPQVHITPRQPGTLPSLVGSGLSAGSSMYATGHSGQPSGPRGRDPSPLRAGHYGTSSQMRNLTPPRGTRGRR